MLSGSRDPAPGRLVLRAARMLTITQSVTP